MTEKMKLINSILAAVFMAISIYLLIQLAIWLPKLSLSKHRLNNAQCLESYNNQGQPPLGACGFDF